MIRAWAFIVGFVIAMTVLVVGTAIEGVNLYFHFESQSWKPVEARIVSMTSHYPGKGFIVVYEYEIGGERIKNDKYQFIFLGMSTGPDLNTEEFKAGQRITVFVDQDKPTRSVVKRRKLNSTEMTAMIGGFVFVFAVVSGMVWVAIKSFRAGIKDSA